MAGGCGLHVSGSVIDSSSQAASEGWASRSGASPTGRYHSPGFRARFFGAGAVVAVEPERGKRCWIPRQPS